MAKFPRNLIRMIRPRGVRTKLLLSFIGVVFFTTLILGVITIRSAKQLAKWNAGRGLELVADMHINHLEFNMEHQLREFEEAPGDMTRYAGGLFVVDAKGGRIGAPAGGAEDLADAAFEDIRRDALGTNETIFAFIEPPGGALHLVFAQEMHGNIVFGRSKGPFVRLGVMRMDAAGWRRMLGVTDTNRETRVLVVDGKSAVRNHPDGATVRFQPLNGDEEALKQKSPATRGSGDPRMIAFAFDGEKRLGVVRDISYLPGWKLIVHQPYGDIYAQVTRLSRQIQFLSVLALAAAIFLGLYRARRITRPITELLKATEEISEGEYSKRVSVHTRDEIGQFAYAFNRMTTTLEENITELKESRGNLEEAYIQLKTESAKQVETDRELHNKIQQIVSLNELTRTMTSTLDLQGVMEKITDLLFSVMTFDACSIKLLDQKKKKLRISIARGLDEEYILKGDTAVGDGISGQAVQLREPLVVEDVEADPRIPADHVIKKMEVRSLVSYPLITKGEPVGVLNLYRRSARGLSEDERRLLEIFSNQAATAIENARLFDSLRESYLNTIQALSMAIDAKDQYTHGHSKRVSDIAQIVGGQMGLNPADMENLRHTGDLHDIGKIGISEMIISKSEKLTVEEYEIIKTHPLVGETIIEPVPFLQEIRKVIRHHHERWDGFGYPDGLRGEEIPLLARIILIADAYDAMTSDRPYRRALKHSEAVREIKKHSGAQFDPRVVEAFTAMMESRTPEEILNGKNQKGKEAAL